MLNEAGRKKLAEDLAQAHATALAFAEDQDAYTLRSLETRMERRDDGEVVIHFGWELTATRTS
ncbi:hypothetical protein ACFWXA_13180 [Streptomyces atroolivaceus]|uniref:hypothetical protein n=1 Tax=Streptomyces atroolivaceus TaxID=66869 RepID=UPI003664998D